MNHTALKRRVLLVSCALVWPNFLNAQVAASRLEAPKAINPFGVYIAPLIGRPINDADTARSHDGAVEQFQAYIAAKTAGIKNADNLPFILTHGRKTGKVVLMVHGLTDSPFSMRALADTYHEAGYNVIGILLAGHGTRPEDLLKVRRSQWRRDVQFGLEIASRLGDQIAIAGFSTGGALALDALAKNYAGKNPRPIKELYLFSPAIEIFDPRAHLFCQAPELASRLKPWKDPAAEEDNPYRYGKMATNAICQVYWLTVENRRTRSAALAAIAKHGVKVFTVQSQADVTISYSSVRNFMRSLPQGSNKEFIVYDRKYHIGHGDVTRPELNPFYDQLEAKLSSFLASLKLAEVPRMLPAFKRPMQSPSLDRLKSMLESSGSF